MVKSKIFHFLAAKYDEYGDSAVQRFENSRNEHDKEISEFIEKISNDGHTFISIDSVGYGRYDSNNRIRTIIIYRENPSREVIVEKNV